MQGQRLSEKTYELIKSMLVQGYSPKKVHQMMPDEIRVSMNVIYRVSNAATYDDYCGVKPEEPEKKVVITPISQTKEIVSILESVNNRLDLLCQMLGEILTMLK